jgi:hypothetical protein
VAVLAAKPYRGDGVADDVWFLLGVVVSVCIFVAAVVLFTFLLPQTVPHEVRGDDA